MHNFLKNNKGVSLVETMVASAIFLMMASGFYAALAAGDSSWQTNSVKTELQSNLRIAMEAMIYDLRQAGPGSIVEAPGTSTQLTFRKPAGISAGSIAWESDQLRFRRDTSNNLLRDTISGGTTTKTVTQNITSLSFTRDATQIDDITVAMTASKNTIKGIPITYNLTFNFQARN